MEKQMLVGLHDSDKTDFPNYALMKISAWHKAHGDAVCWYDPMFTGHCDKVYLSKVFSFTPDFAYPIDADEVERGGSGYCIKVVDGKEVFDQSKNKPLPYEVDTSTRTIHSIPTSRKTPPTDSLLADARAVVTSALWRRRKAAARSR